MALARTIGGWIARYLTQPSRAPYSSIPTDIALLEATVRAGDVVVMEGRQRISTAIKYLTQSTWSHAALCVSQADASSSAPAQFIEADAIDGVRLVTVGEFEGLNSRICRPVGLADDEIAAVTSYALAHVGDAYDLANVVDLARYLFPTPPVPGRWRRRMIALGSGDPTRAICSTLVAQAFQSIRYPILPHITRAMAQRPECRDSIQELMHIRHHSLFTPRDFDVSPYFRIVKPTLEHGFTHRELRWADHTSPEPDCRP